MIAIHIILVPTRVAPHGLMVIVPVHHASRLGVTHSVLVHPILTALPSGPISIDPRILRTPALSVAGLVRLLRCALRLNRSGLSLRLLRPLALDSCRVALA
ncbi:hypothetical protein ABH977_008368 [Bradyrhizobium ottawaense]